MYRQRSLGYWVPSVASKLWRVALAFADFAIIMVRPSRRSHYGQQFLYKTEGQTFERSFAAFGAFLDGQRLIQERPDSVALLRDRAWLRSLPADTLGRSYYDFMTAGAIDEDLYLDGAIEAGRRFERDPARAWYRTRVEAGHDMRHVLTGYGIDPLGETCLMAFRFGQTRHAGTCVIAASGLLILACRREPRLLPAMREAYRNGRAARLLDLLPWEEAMDRPLEDLRKKFGIETPHCYLPPGS